MASINQHLEASAALSVEGNTQWMRGVPLLYAVHTGGADGVLDMEPILAYAFADLVRRAAT